MPADSAACIEKYIDAYTRMLSHADCSQADARARVIDALLAGASDPESDLHVIRSDLNSMQRLESLGIMVRDVTESEVALDYFNFYFDALRVLGKGTRTPSEARQQATGRLLRSSQSELLHMVLNSENRRLLADISEGILTPGDLKELGLRP
jgi:hypothetical protein